MATRKTSTSRRRKRPIEVVLADDHPVVREGMKSILERQPDLEVVAAVGDGSAAIQEVERLKPKVVVMEISLPRVNGIDAAKVITEKFPEIGVVMLSTHSSPHIVRRAIEAGARGYVVKNSAPSEVVQAVRTVAEGRPYLGSGLPQELVAVSKRVPFQASTVEALTKTEHTILKLVAEGNSNPEIAATIGLSYRTVETYRLRLMRKLGIENMAALVRYAIRHGVIPLD